MAAAVVNAADGLNVRGGVNSHRVRRRAGENNNNIESRVFLTIRTYAMGDASHAERTTD